MNQLCVTKKKKITEFYASNKVLLELNGEEAKEAVSVIFHQAHRIHSTLLKQHKK
jgi:hypothetical protein